MRFAASGGSAVKSSRYLHQFAALDSQEWKAILDQLPTTLVSLHFSLLSFWPPEKAGLAQTREGQEARQCPPSWEPGEPASPWPVDFGKGRKVDAFTFKPLIVIGNFPEFRILTLLNVGENIAAFKGQFPTGSLCLLVKRSGIAHL